MKRYVFDKAGLDVLDFDSSNELHDFKNFPLSSALLTDDQLSLLISKGVWINEAGTTTEVTQCGPDYPNTDLYYIKAQKKRLTGQGCKVAIIDSGCAVNVINPDVAVNFTTYPDIDQPLTANGHGTATTSQIRSQIGTANGCFLYAIQAGVNGIFNEFYQLQVFDYVIEQGIDVISMSYWWSAGVDTPTLRLALQAVIDAGTVVVAAAGNSGTLAETLIPAALPGVVAVNGITEAGGVIWRNSIPPEGGHGITVAVGGVGVYIVNTAGNVTISNGTSFSAPIFTALFANYKEQTGIQDNYVLLDYILNKCIRKEPVLHFGLGSPTY